MAARFVVVAAAAADGQRSRQNNRLHGVAAVAAAAVIVVDRIWSHSHTLHAVSTQVVVLELWAAPPPPPPQCHAGQRTLGLTIGAMRRMSAGVPCHQTNSKNQRTNPVKHRGKPHFSVT